MVVDTFRYYAGAPERLLGDTIPVAGGQAFTVREPLGVVGLIMPWNFPLTIAAWKLGPALAAGNTVVLKPAELTPLTALRFAEIAAACRATGGRGQRRRRPRPHVRAATGRAPGRGEDRVHRLDRGRTLDRGRRRADDQARDARARRQVSRTSCSPTPTSRRRPRRPRAPCSATPGRTAARARGSSCERGAARSLHGAARAGGGVDRASATRSIRGDADGTADLRRPARDGRVVPRRRRAGGDPRHGAGRLPATGSRRRSSCPVEPRARAAREEIFGPIAAVIPFADEEEAVRLANDTIYGLSGSIWTRDGARALRVARAVRDGRALDQLQHLGARARRRSAASSSRATDASSVRTRSTHTPR